MQSLLWHGRLGRRKIGSIFTSGCTHYLFPSVHILPLTVSIYRFADRDMALRYSNMGIGHQVSNRHSASVDTNTDGPSVDNDIDDWVDGSDELNDKGGESSDNDTDGTTGSGSGGEEDEEDDTSGEESGEVDDSDVDGEDSDLV